MQRVWLLVGLGVLLAGSQASAVDIDWIPIGDPGNPADDTGFGSVADAYRISRHEITVSQYAEFLNSIGQSDPHGAYIESMTTNGGIIRSGSNGSFSYSTKSGWSNQAMGNVQFANALRFTNWMNNGQGSGDTESGAYTITGTNYSNGSISRNPGASIFLPSENEWYKAAYFDPQSASYFDYPTSSNAPTICALPGATPNTANCGGLIGAGKGLTDVGAYSNSGSPFGTYDQGGNVWEWNESWLTGDPGGLRGSSTGSNASNTSFELSAGYRAGGQPPPSPGASDVAYGFRISATVPEPSTGLLLATGLLGLAATKRLRRSFSGAS